MKSITLLFFTAMLGSAVLLPLLIRAYARMGKLDLPDEKRKFHAQAIPRAGGVAIICAFIAALALLQLLPAGANVVIDRYSVFLGRLFPAVGVIFLTGLLDDWYDLRPRYKILGQLCASLLAYGAGIRILPLPESLDWLSLGLTVFWLILSANAFNLIDGSDGLAGMLGLLSSCGLIALALILDYQALALLFAPLAGAIVPFLRLNWPPAKVFMGDSGSLSIGFLIGCGGAALSRKFGDGSGLLAAILLLALPLAEVAISTLRRTLRGQSIFEADCNHLHHKLRNQGFDARELLLQMSLFSALAVAIASSLFVLDAPERILLLGFLGILFLRELSNLAYTEFKVLGRMIWGGEVRLWLRQQIELESLERELEASRTADDIWRNLQAASRKLGLCQIRLRLGSMQWEDVRPGFDCSEGWQVRVDLPKGCWVNFHVGSNQSGRFQNPSGELARIVRRQLSARRLGQLLPEVDPIPVAPMEVLLLDRSA